MCAKRKHYGTSGEHALTGPEIDKLLATITHLEDKALLMFAISTGIRREDVVAIPLSGMDIKTGWISFYESKKKRPWKIPIGGETLTTMRMHLRTLPKEARWLFPGKDPKKHISGRTAYNILQRWLERAGLKSRPFHALRATCIKTAQRNGWKVTAVMALTGDTARTIQEHYDTPTSEEMMETATNKPIV